jgi:hypothetical protein
MYFLQALVETKPYENSHVSLILWHACLHILAFNEPFFNSTWYLYDHNTIYESNILLINLQRNTSKAHKYY